MSLWSRNDTRSCNKTRERERESAEYVEPCIYAKVFAPYVYLSYTFRRLYCNWAETIECKWKCIFERPLRMRFVRSLVSVI